MNTISKVEFLSTHKPCGIRRNAIFGDRKALMEEIYSTGAPIWCDESYYCQEQEMQRVVKVDDHFETSIRKHLESWRDCHYYSCYEDAEGNKSWILTGGRYD